MLPASCFSEPFNTFTRVDFPVPLPPIMPTSCPDFPWKLKLCIPLGEFLKWTIGALYDHFAKKAYAEYTAELVRRNNEVAKMQQAHVEQEKQKKQEIQVKSVKIGRNSKCTCGSGKKYKKCCLGKEKEKKVE